MKVRPFSLVATGAIAAFYALAILESEAPLAMAVGLALIAWVALEACWHLFNPKEHGNERKSMGVGLTAWTRLRNGLGKLRGSDGGV